VPRHRAHSDVQRTRAALEKARREVTSGGAGASFSRTAAEDAERAAAMLEQRLEEENDALERARDQLRAFDDEQQVSSQPRQLVRDLSPAERRRRDELRHSLRDAETALPERPKSVPFERLGGPGQLEVCARCFLVQSMSRRPSASFIRLSNDARLSFQLGLSRKTAPERVVVHTRSGVARMARRTGGRRRP